MTVPHPTPARITAKAYPSGSFAALAIGLVVIIPLAVWIGEDLPSSRILVAVSIGLYAVISGITILTIRGHHPATDFGWPNRVTTLRSLATALIAGLTAAVVVGDTASDQMLYGFAALALAAILLDGFDGWIARRYGPMSPFGARYDMEIDALLILVLSIFAVGLGKVGVWMVLSGLLRYLFVMAGWLLPFMNAPLPPSFRRKLVCVVQLMALWLLMLPAVTAPIALPVAALSLAALVWSFAVDTLWLIRHREEVA